MKIAIELNEVIRDFIDSLIKNYKKVTSSNNAPSYDDVTTNKFSEIFRFNDEDGNPSMDKYYDFLYEDYVFEIFSRADVMERNIGSVIRIWMSNIIEEKGINDEDIILYSPMEMGLSIPSTLGFLSRIGCAFRTVLFPKDSTDIWNKADLVITANPTVIEAKPEDKHCIKIESPYNKNIECEYSSKTLTSLLSGDNKTLNELITKYETA